MLGFGSQSYIFATAELAGVVLLVSTMLLIGMRRIYIDSQTKEPTEFEIPLIGKVKTQAPALVLIAAGVFLIVYAIHESKAPSIQWGTLKGEVDLGGASATVLVLAIPDKYQYSQEVSGPFSISVPLIPGANYQVKYEVDRHIWQVDSSVLNGVITTDKFTYQPPVPLDVQPVKDISDEELKKLRIN
jgi:hypothetical protein